MDATVLADFLVGEPKLQAPAIQLVRLDPDWITVGLWRYELGNVFWKIQRFGASDGKTLKQNLATSEELLLETVDQIDRTAVWELAVAQGLTFYDASYVWLARSRGVELFTRDKQVLRECPDVAKKMPVAN